MEPADVLSLRSDTRAALLLIGLRGDWQPYCCAQAVRLARSLDAWNPHREAFKPLVLAVAPDGREVFRELSRDFTDRPDDEPVLRALDSLGLDPVDIPPWRPGGVDHEPSGKAFKPASFIPYFRAITMNTGALAERMHDERDRDQLLTEHRMADSFLAAFDEWRAEHPPSEQR